MAVDVVGQLTYVLDVTAFEEQIHMTATKYRARPGSRVRVDVRLPPDIVQRVNALAKKRKTTRTDVVESLIADALFALAKREKAYDASVFG